MLLDKRQSGYEWGVLFCHTGQDETADEKIKYISNDRVRTKEKVIVVSNIQNITNPTAGL